MNAACVETMVLLMNSFVAKFVISDLNTGWYFLSFLFTLLFLSPPLQEQKAFQM